MSAYILDIILFSTQSNLNYILRLMVILANGAPSACENSARPKQTRGILIKPHKYYNEPRINSALTS